MDENIRISTGFLELMTQPVILMDVRGKIVHYNHSFDRLFNTRGKGFSLKSIFGKNPEAYRSFLSAIKEEREESGYVITGQGIHAGFRSMPVRIDTGESLYIMIVDPMDTSDSEGLPGYFNSLLSSISPIVTVDREKRVRYANGSFLNEFHLDKSSVIGKNLTDVMPIKKKDRDVLIHHIDNHDTPVQNVEFSAGRRIFGYSLFRFEEETGIILKEITSLKRLQKQVESLHARMLRLQEKERQKIAAELHDSVGQTILAAKLNFTTFMLQPGEMGDRYDAGLELIDRASQELREIYQNLYPSILRDLGLEAAIRWYAKNYLEVKGIETNLSFVLSRRLPEELEAGIFRMVQELFNNIVKHSSANSATLKLTRKKNTVHLSVSDDGLGFDMNEAKYRGGLGLANLRSRVEDLGGDIQIESAENRGTSTEIHMPLTFRLKDT